MLAVAGMAMLVAFVPLLMIGLPHRDGSPSLIGRSEALTATYSVLLVGLLLGGMGLIFVGTVQ